MIKYKKIQEKINKRIDTLTKNYKKSYDYYLNELKENYPKKKETGKEEYEFKNTTYRLENSEYMFYEFDTFDFGAVAALNSSQYEIIENVRIDYCIFKNCNIKNMVFKNCSFSGCVFEKVYFHNVSFENCIFSVPVIEKGNVGVDDIYYSTTVFKKCTFVANFINCNIENVLFQKTNFTLSEFNNCLLQFSVFDMCAVSELKIKQCNLCDFSIINTDILDINFLEPNSTIVNENTLIDYKLNVNKQNEKAKTKSGWIFNNYEELCTKKARTILEISKVFSYNNMPKLEGEYFYRSKLIELRGLKSWDKIKSIVSLIVCGYGERPLYKFFTILATILIFGVIYMFCGIQADCRIINYPCNEAVGICNIISDLGKCMFFSVTTFSTVGYGNYVPLGTSSMIFSAIHMILGVGLCALWTGCMLRKLIR